MPDVGVSRTIWFVVFPGFELLDLGGPLCAFNLAIDFHQAAYQVHIVSAVGGLVRGSSGVAIDTLVPPSAYHLDTLLVVGAPTTEILYGQTETADLVGTIAPRARRKASICTGAFLLAAAGLLDGRRATTHWRYAGELQRRHPTIKVDADRIFVREDDVWTSAGITAGIDLALAMIAEDVGDEIAQKTARELVLYHRRSGGQSQFSSLLELKAPSGRFGALLSWARENLEAPLTVDDLAEQAGISSRHFARAFAAETGTTPSKAIERLRIEVARQRVQSSADAIERGAETTGFRDPERMRRAFIRAFGQPPQSLRRAARAG